MPETGSFKLFVISALNKDEFKEIDSVKIMIRCHLSTKQFISLIWEIQLVFVQQTLRLILNSTQFF